MWRLAPRAPRRLGQPWAKLGLIPHGRPKAQPHGGCHWMLDSNPSAPDDDLVSPARGGAGPPPAGAAPSSLPRPLGLRLAFPPPLASARACIYPHGRRGERGGEGEGGNGHLQPVPPISLSFSLSSPFPQCARSCVRACARASVCVYACVRVREGGSTTRT